MSAGSQPILILSVCLLLSSGALLCETATVNIYPADQTLWSDSRIQLTCKSGSVKIDDCLWFVNNRRLNASDATCQVTPHSCSVTLAATVALSGEWKCKLLPSGDNRPSMSASTRITVLRVNLREFLLLFIGLLIFAGMSMVIGLLLLRVRRLSERLMEMSERRTNQYVFLSADESCSPPPSYQTVVGERAVPSAPRLSDYGSASTGHVGDVSSSK